MLCMINVSVLDVDKIIFSRKLNMSLQFFPIPHHTLNHAIHVPIHAKQLNFTNRQQNVVFFPRDLSYFLFSAIFTMLFAPLEI